MRRMIPTTLALALALNLFALAFALDAHASPDRLRELLSMIDVQPTREQLVEAGAGVHGEVLEAIALDRASSRYVRTRAASSLSFFGDALARASLAKVIAEALDDPEVRVQAIAALSVSAGPTAVPRLSSLLADPVAEVRAAAVRGLVRTRSPEARAVLTAALENERAPLVRAQIERALTAR